MATSNYAKSLKRLEEIIEQIENETVDVDELAAKVKEAAALILDCKKRIEKAEMEVKQVVEGFKEKVEED